MISWIQHHLIRHGRWVFLTLLAVIIVAFVFTIGNTPGCTTNRSGYEENLFYGIDLNAPRERDVVVQKTSLSAFLDGRQFQTDEQFQSALTGRIAMLHLADETGVPEPTQEALANYIRTKNAFRGEDGQFSPDAYTRFVDNFEANPRAPQGLVIQVLAEDFRIAQVQKALSGPGYLLPAEALAQTMRNKTELDLSTAGLAYTDFSPQIEPEETALREFYETNAQRYEIPERIRASYVAFPSSAYADQVAEVSEADLRQHFAANRAEIVAAYEAANPDLGDGAEGENEDAATSVTFEQVRTLVAQSYSEALATRAANEAAQAFAFQLYRDEIKRDSAAFNQLLNEQGLSLTPIEPYTLAGARQRALSPEMLESAFALGGNRYYSDAYPIENGFAVLIYEGRIAPVIPPFEEVAAEVESDYLAAEKRRLFNEEGRRLQEALQTAVSEGRAFTEVAAELGLQTETYEPFVVRQPPAGLNRSAVSQAQRMEAGEVSPMLNAGGVGTFVHVAEKSIPELDPANEDVTQASDMLQRWASFSTQSSLLNELVVRGLPEEAK